MAGHGPCRLALKARLFFRQCRRHASNLQQQPPSIAPKPSINIKHIRQNPELYAQNCIDRNYKSQSSHSSKIVALFDEWQSLQRNGRGLREKNNTIRTKLSHSRNFSGREVEGQDAAPQDRESLLSQGKELKSELTAIEVQEADLQSQINSLAAELPNLTSPITPIGPTPQVLSYINQFPLSVSHSRSHVQIGNELSLLDFTSAGTTSGWGFYYLKSSLALLEQALIQYALHVAILHGFTPITPPSLVYSHIASACGFRPRDQGGEQQTYAIQPPSSDNEQRKPELCLAGTAEIPFAALHANTTLSSTAFPLLIVGPSRCYRAEAGARGIDTKGLYRVHEFTKVEMFGWTLPTPEAEEEAFNKLLAVQTEILEDLGLPARILEMPSHDLGASATRKQDIEAFFPSRRDRDDGWGEVTSASMCGDYQTRRLATRLRIEEGENKGSLEFPHTVNGTAVAVPRVLAALMENGWDERKWELRLPECLQRWMPGGMSVIRGSQGKSKMGL